MVRERVRDVVEHGEQREEPCLRVRQRLDGLLALPPLVLDTRLVLGNALHDEDALVRGKEPRGPGGVGGHEETGRGDEREDARDDDEPLSGLEVARMSVEDPERDEPYDELCCRAVSVGSNQRKVMRTYQYHS